MAYVDITNDGITFRITYTQTSNEATNKSVVAITKLQLKSTTYTGLHYLDGDISIDGLTAVEMSSFAGSHGVYIDSTGTFYDVSGQFGSVTIAHEDDGTKSVSFALNSIAGIHHTGTERWNVSGSKTVALTTIPRGLVHIDSGSGFVDYQVYIDNGSSWDLYMPYVDNGSAWDLCS